MGNKSLNRKNLEIINDGSLKEPKKNGLISLQERVKVKVALVLVSILLKK